MRTIVVGALVIGVSVAALLSGETMASAQQETSGSTQVPSPQNQTQSDGAASSSGGATQASPGGQAGAAGQSSAEGAGASSGNSQELAKSAEKGSLKSPYQDYASVAQEGHQRWMSAGCNGCHGGTGGGGMGPPLTNPVWVYGSDDDTLALLQTASHCSGVRTAEAA